MEDVRHSYSINRICIQFISFRLLNYDKKIEKITTATTSATAIRLIVYSYSIQFISFRLLNYDENIEKTTIYTTSFSKLLKRYSKAKLKAPAYALPSNERSGCP